MPNFMYGPDIARHLALHEMTRLDEELELRHPEATEPLKGLFARGPRGLNTRTHRA